MRNGGRASKRFDSDGVPHGLGTMPSQRWSVLLPRCRPMSCHRRQVNQHCEACGSLNKGADRGAAETDDQITSPIPRHCTILHLGRAFADEDRGSHERLAPTTRACSWDPQRSAGPKALRQFSLQCASALHIKRLVNRLVADAHRRVIRVVEPQALGNLLRAPCQSPPSALAWPMASTFPTYGWSSNRSIAGCENGTRKPILHIGSQRRVRRELRHFWTTRRPLRMPLSSRRPVIQVAATCCRVAPQLPRDRRWRPSQAASDLPHAKTFRPQQRYLLPLHKVQVAPGTRLARR